MFGLGSFWPWMASKSRCVIKAMNDLEQKVIRWSVSLPTFFSDKRKFGRRQGENKANKYKTAPTSTDEEKHRKC